MSTSFPKGVSESPAILKCCFAKGTIMQPDGHAHRLIHFLSKEEG